MRKFTIEKGYLIFDQVFINKELAYQVEEENGTHKDTVKEGYYIFEVEELEGFATYEEMINVPCNYSRFFETYEEALQDAKEEELDLV